MIPFHFNQFRWYFILPHSVKSSITLFTKGFGKIWILVGRPEFNQQVNELLRPGSGGGRLAPLELAGCTNIRTWLTLFRINFDLIQLCMLYGCLLCGPLYHVFVHIMSVNLALWKYNIYIINQYETGLVCLNHSVLIPHLSKHGQRTIGYYYGTKYLAMGPKTVSFVNTHPISTPARFEMKWMKTFSVSTRKPQIWPIFSLAGDQIFGHGAENQIFSKHSTNKHTF